jgi:hypothetical protein
MAETAAPEMKTAETTSTAAPAAETKTPEAPATETAPEAVKVGVGIKEIAGGAVVGAGAATVAGKMLYKSALQNSTSATLKAKSPAKLAQEILDKAISHKNLEEAGKSNIFKKAAVVFKDGSAKTKTWMGAALLVAGLATGAIIHHARKSHAERIQQEQIASQSAEQGR